MRPIESARRLEPKAGMASTNHLTSSAKVKSNEPKKLPTRTTDWAKRSRKAFPRLSALLESIHPPRGPELRKMQKTVYKYCDIFHPDMLRSSAVVPETTAS